MPAAYAPLPADTSFRLNLEASANDEALRTIVRSSPFVRDPAAFGEAVGASFVRENIIASTIHELTDGDTQRPIDDVAGYNPYARLRELYDDATREALKAEISDGEFDEARSDKQLAAIVADIQYEKGLQEKMSADPAGAFVGALLGGLADPTSYLPMVGMATKAGMVGRASMFAFNTALQTGVSEAVLQATQRERTLDETLMNIGSSAMLGGGLGIFAGAMSKGNVLHPRNADNPLHRENLRRDGEVTRTTSGAVDEFDAAELRALNDDYPALDAYAPRRASSAGAAALDDVDVRLARSEPATGVGKAVRWAGEKFNSATIKGQVLRSASAVARSVGIRIFDPAGLILEHNLRGIGNPLSAQTGKAIYMAEYEKLADNFKRSFRALRGDMKGVKASLNDLYLLTQRHLYAMVENDPKVGKLQAKYGQHYEALNAEAQRLSEQVHASNDLIQARLQKEGLLQDPVVVNGMVAELKTAREAVKAAKAAGADEASIEALRRSRDELVEKVRKEKAKPPSYGREYGHAQMWNRDALVQNEANVKAWLHEALSLRPHEDWLLENHKMDLETLDGLPAAEKQEILEDWAGDAVVWRLEQAELQVRASAQADKQAKLDLRDALQNSRLARRDETNITLSEARKRRDALHKRVEAGRAKKRSWEAEIRAHFEAAEAARLQTRDRTKREAAGEQTTAEATRSARAERLTARQFNLNQTIDDILTDPLTPVDADGNPRVFDAGDVAQQQGGVAKAEADLLRSEAVVRQDMDEVSVVTARQQGAAREAAVGLRQLERDAADLAEFADELDAKLSAAEAKHAAATKARQDMTEALKVAKETRRITAKTARAAVRELRAAKRQTPLSDVIDEVYRHLTTRGEVPHGIVSQLETVDTVTGRLKQRALNLSREQRSHALNQGWLRDDLSLILRMQHDQIASTLSFNEAMNIGPGRRYESWSEVRGAVIRDYEDMLNAETDQARKNALSQDMKVTLANIDEARARHMGGNFVDDGTSTGWMNWGMKKFTDLNLIRYNSGFTLSSLTDIAAVALRHGNPGKLLFKYGRQAREIMRQAQADDPTHFTSFIAALDVAGAHAAAARWGVDDVTTGGMAGYGIGIGATKKATGAVDKALEVGIEVGHRIGGMGIWNGGWKVIAGLAMMDGLRGLTARSVKGELTALEIADLASLGIGKAEAARIARYIETHGEVLPNGRFDPHLEKWEGEDGAAAARDVELALVRDMNRAITTPDVGDTSRLMSKPAWKFLLAFQTFAFTFANQVGYPLAQRISTFRDKRAMMAFGMLLGSGMAVMVGKDLINGRDPSDRFTSENWAKTIYEVIDRTGLTGYLSPYIDSALKLAPVPLIGGGGDRYARNGWAESLLGINFALASDIQRAGSAVSGLASAEPDPDAMRKVMALTPYKMQANLLGRLLGLNDDN